MAATVFYLDEVPEPGAVAVLDGPEGRHAATVRRIRIGEPITLSDGRGVLAESEVVAAQRDRLELAVRNRVLAAPQAPPVTVVQALPKSDRSELAVELMTEAGADTIIPWQAARCVANWEGKAAKGVDKWRAAGPQAPPDARPASAVRPPTRRAWGGCRRPTAGLSPRGHGRGPLRAAARHLSTPLAA
ncbi:RsmE family RNA methyltransferase, partial [Nocardia abscessus]|uniref:RsmE family RNA methyltransferase n=1 Tax=Nocardia abscessus TaxID=120957 RepID=UPI0024564A84